jgi:hypothetical protein
MMMRTLVLLALAASLASSSPVVVSGFGTFGADAPGSPYSAANGTWAFSLLIDQDAAALSTTGFGGFLTDSTVFSNFQYLVNGSLVATTPKAVFYPAASVSGINLVLDGGNPETGPGGGPGTGFAISMSPALLGAGASAGDIKLLTGSYSINPGGGAFITFYNQSNSGTYTVPTGHIDITATPEPSGLPVVAAAGLLALAVVRIRKRA